MKSKISILIVDDSAFIRLLINDLLSQEPDLEVVGSATNGKEAVEQTLALKPDVVLMDMTMGEFDGLYGVEHIMKTHPTPILILSSIGNTNLDPIFDALRLGAVDYINKPKRGGSKIREMDLELIQRIKKVAKAKPRTIDTHEPSTLIKKKTIHSKGNFDIVIIGASTGGPSAVEKIVTNLPKDLGVPVVIIQHMPENFIPSFASRLDGLSELKVEVAQIGQPIPQNTVLIAPGNTNIVLKKSANNEFIIGATSESYKEYNNPSINAFMLSAAEICGKKCLSIILTGMGKDGTRGIQEIKKSGGLTVAQDESSSIIFGMPKHAIASGCIAEVLNISEIADFIIKKVQNER
ncbi:MAG: two-component system chemotaxis response regulator CheB [Cyclobacteriaceae bacterium]